jgi:5-methylcytosine-specific restriction enzyme A
VGSCTLASTMPTTHGQGNPDWTFEETILALDVLQRNSFKVPGKTSAEVKQLSRLLCSLPIHAGTKRNAQFRNADGVYLKLQNLISRHPSRAGRGLNSSIMDKQVWDDYWQKPAETRHLVVAIEAGAKQLGPEVVDTYNVDSEPFQEGQLLTAIHKRRERARGLRARVVARQRESKGGLACEGCGRDPAIKSRGTETEASMYEVHHLRPLADLGPTTTRITDLALLCATCHRVIHHLIRLDRKWYTIDDLRAALDAT